MNKYTKWIPLSSYGFSGNEFIVLARVNKNTGMMYFKTKKLIGFGIVSCTSNGSIGLSKVLKIEEQWAALMELRSMQNPKNAFIERAKEICGFNS